MKKEITYFIHVSDWMWAALQRGMNKKFVDLSKKDLQQKCFWGPDSDRLNMHPHSDLFSLYIKLI